jgi:hypothetical protein
MLFKDIIPVYSDCENRTRPVNAKRTVFFLRWYETVSELQPPTDLLFFTQMMICEHEALVEWW